MKKILYLFLSIFILVGSISTVCLAAEEASPSGDGGSSGNGGSSEDIKHTEGPKARKFVEHNPVRLLDAIYVEANGYKGDEVQNTQFDQVSSRGGCADSRFTISNTLCSLKSLSKNYFQYLMYIGLTIATILIIRNGLTLVTSTDREKQFAKFKKNITYIVVGVILLIGFYYIIDFFVSIVNLIAERNG